MTARSTDAAVLVSKVQRLVADYDGTTYADLCSEISDGFMGETGDLVREHAEFVLALRTLTADVQRVSDAWAEVIQREQRANNEALYDAEQAADSRERAIRWAVTLEGQNAAMEARIGELQREMAARVTPPHLDGAYREGIYTGLQLAWRIINGQPDENHPGVTDDDPGPYVSTYPTARLAAAGSTE